MHGKGLSRKYRKGPDDSEYHVPVYLRYTILEVCQEYGWDNHVGDCTGFYSHLRFRAWAWVPEQRRQELRRITSGGAVAHLQLSCSRFLEGGNRIITGTGDGQKDYYEVGHLER